MWKASRLTAIHTHLLQLTESLYYNSLSRTTSRLHTTQHIVFLLCTHTHARTFPCSMSSSRLPVVRSPARALISLLSRPRLPCATLLLLSNCHCRTICFWSVHPVLFYRLSPVVVVSWHSLPIFVVTFVIWATVPYIFLPTTGLGSNRKDNIQIDAIYVHTYR